MIAQVELYVRYTGGLETGSGLTYTYYEEPEILLVSKNDEFCIKNKELCIKNKELCI